MARTVRKKVVKVEDTPVVPVPEFSPLPPVPGNISEFYLDQTIRKIQGSVSPVVIPAGDLLDRMNFLMGYFGLSINVRSGCGAKFVRDALAVLVEEYNKRGR